MMSSPTVMARQAVQSIVAESIQVSVDAGHAFATDGGTGDDQRARSASALVSVELTGQTNEPKISDRVVSVKGEACAWGADEIVSAALPCGPRNASFA